MLLRRPGCWWLQAVCSEQGLDRGCWLGEEGQQCSEDPPLTPFVECPQQQLSVVVKEGKMWLTGVILSRGFSCLWSLPFD